MLSDQKADDDVWKASKDLGVSAGPLSLMTLSLHKPQGLQGPIRENLVQQAHLLPLGVLAATVKGLR